MYSYRDDIYKRMGLLTLSIGKECVMSACFSSSHIILKKTTITVRLSNQPNVLIVLSTSVTTAPQFGTANKNVEKRFISNNFIKSNVQDRKAI